MPKKTIYVKDEDLPLFEKVRADGDDSISSRFADFLRFEESLKKPMPIQFTPMPEMPTLRDQFAMAALSGLLSDPSSSGPKGSAQAAYEYADAMIEARKK